MTKLLIVESPTKAKTIQGYLGDQWEVHASVGHIRDLPEDAIGVDAPDFRPTYVYTSSGRDVSERLKRVAKRCDDVYLGTDDDREGEAIAWHLQQVLGLDKPKRITFGEITKTSIQHAVQNPRPIDVHRVASQEARRICDRFVGYLVSPALQRACGSWDLSAGRVQSIALKLVVDLEKEIQGHTASAYYNVVASFGQWQAEWDHGQKHFTDEAAAEGVARHNRFRVASNDVTRTTSAPFAPFITSSLQRAASNALKIRPKECMELAQSLYQKGLISYMRTDNPNLSDETASAVRDLAEKLGLPVSPKTRSWKAPEGAQEAHKAITPTDLSKEDCGDSDKEKALYNLIRKRTIACQLADAEFDVMSITLQAIDNDQVKFRSEFRKLINPGYKALLKSDESEDLDEETEVASFPVIEAGSIIIAETVKVDRKKTKAKSRYTEASLVKKLETLKIGRPSSYAGILETIIKERGYVKHKPKTQFLEATEKGIQVADKLRTSFSFMKENYTSELEKTLDDIQVGKAKYKAVLSKMHSDLVNEVASFNGLGPEFPCPKCGQGMVRIVTDKNTFWGCSAFAEKTCDVVLADQDGKPQMKAAG